MPSKTGVLFISSPDAPGADTFIHMLIMRALDRSRFDAHVACSADAARTHGPAYEALTAIPALKIRPTVFGPSLSGLAGAAKAAAALRDSAPTIFSVAGLAAYIRRNRIAVLHSTDRPRDAVSCVLLGKLTGAKSIVHVHVKCAAWMGRPVRWAFKNADGLIGISAFVAESLIANGYARERVHCVLNAIDPAKWASPGDVSGIRRTLRVAADAPLIVCAARLFKDKGQDDLIRAVSMIRDEFPSVTLLVVGRDDRQAMRGSFSADLEALAARLGISSHVIFTGYRTDMPALVAASDVFALPSFEEPFGLVFLEAMTMRKPVVALNNGGTPEVVEHGKSGLLSAPGDLDGLAGNLRTLLRDPQLRARLGAHGARQVSARFTPDRLARDVEEVYDRVLAGKEARAFRSDERLLMSDRSSADIVS